MRFLGKGLMVVSFAQYGHWLYKDPSLNTIGQIAVDMTGYNLFKPLAEGYAESELGNNYNLMSGNINIFGPIS